MTHWGSGQARVSVGTQGGGQLDEGGEDPPGLGEPCGPATVRHTENTMASGGLARAVSQVVYPGI